MLKQDKTCDWDKLTLNRMVKLTAEVLRRKSEHNEGTLADLEEIALHQLEIEKIEAVGTLCRKLRILYLQNNIIGKIENIQHLKELEYLNLALNNITKIEGLESCEFLKKLDLTVNFISFANLEESVDNLQQNKQLREIYVVGNPFADWEGHREYLIHRLPWLDKIDGSRITKSEQIKAAQRFEALQQELAEKIKIEEEQNREKSLKIESIDDEDEHAPYTPELRTEMYREMAEEKAEKEQREKDRMPKERNYEKEHEEAIEQARAKQFFQDGRIRQCNEAQLDFRFEEDKDNFYFIVGIPRFADTSLIDCQVYPNFVQVVFKDKTLRVAVPGGEAEEVRAGQSSCQRSKTTGELKVTMPKLKPGEMLVLGKPAGENSNTLNTKKTDQAKRTKQLEKPKKTAELLVSEAVDIKTIYKGKENPNLATEGQAGPISVHSSAPVAVKEQQRLEARLNVPSLEEDDSSEDEE